jgi:hypothetical protein
MITGKNIGISIGDLEFNCQGGFKLPSKFGKPTR